MNNIIEGFLLLLGLVFFRCFLCFAQKLIEGGNEGVWRIVILLTIIVCAAPWILIDQKVLGGGPFNIGIGFLYFFYFPFVVGRISMLRTGPPSK